MKTTIDKILHTALRSCFEKGLLKETALPVYVIEIPNNPEHGHFATNLPLTMASSQKKSPKEIARIIVDHMGEQGEFIEKVDIAGPGFINFRIRRDEWLRFLGRLMESGERYGSSNSSPGFLPEPP